MQRTTGFAPDAITVSVALDAFILSVTPNSTETAQAGLSASSPGAIGQNDRLVIVMAQDLSNAGFALPVVVGDQVTLPNSAEILAITRVDAYKRAVAGAIELTCAGVS